MKPVIAPRSTEPIPAEGAREPAGLPAAARQHAAAPGFVRGSLLIVIVAGCAVALRFDGRLPIHDAALGAAFAGFFGLMAAESRRRRLRIQVVAVTSAVLFALALAAPSRQSQDVWAYTLYGRILVVHHADPYVRPPADFPQDPYYPRIYFAWRTQRSLYGPLFLGVAAAVARLAGTSTVAARLGFQGVAALAMAVAAWLIWRRARDPVAVAFIGLNPLIVVAVVNGGHNDALVGLAILGAVLLAERRRHGAAGAAMGMAALVKLVALLPLGALLLWTWRRRGWKAAAWLGGAGVAVTGIGYLAAGISSLRTVHQSDLLQGPFTIWRLPWLLHFLASPAHADLSRRLVSIYFAVPRYALPTLALFALLLVVPRLRDGSPVPAMAAAGMAYFLVALYIVPWYIVWILPALALVWRRRMAWVAEGAAVALLAIYLETANVTWVNPTPTMRLREFMVLYMVGAVILIVTLAVSAAREI